MRGGRSFLILLVVALGLGGYIYFVESKRDRPTQPRRPRRTRSSRRSRQVRRDRNQGRLG